MLFAHVDLVYCALRDVLSGKRLQGICPYAQPGNCINKQRPLKTGADRYHIGKYAKQI